MVLGHATVNDLAVPLSGGDLARTNADAGIAALGRSFSIVKPDQHWRQS